MFDPLSPLITVVGMSLAYLAGRSRLRAEKPRPVKAVCPCGHPVAFHDDHTGACREQEKIYLNSSDELVQCSCVRYAGPELVSTTVLQDMVLRDRTTDDGTSR